MGFTGIRAGGLPFSGVSKAWKLRFKNQSPRCTSALHASKMLPKLAKQASALAATRNRAPTARVGGLMGRNSASGSAPMKRSLLSSFQRRSYMVPSFSMDTEASAQSIIVSQAVADVRRPCRGIVLFDLVNRPCSSSNIFSLSFRESINYVRPTRTRIYT